MGCPSDPGGLNHNLADIKAGLFNVGSWWSGGGLPGYQDNPVDVCRIWPVSYEYTGWAQLEKHHVTPGYTGNEPDIMDYENHPACLYTGNQTLNDILWERDPSLADQDIQYTDEVWGKEITIYRLREGIERFTITDINNPAASSTAQSEIAVMWDEAYKKSDDGDRYFNHVPGGSNVLWMDGHVEWVKYPGKFPVNRCYAAK
jgi:prepilin-type processing-associated H-X9-DG protein